MNNAIDFTAFIYPFLGYAALIILVYYTASKVTRRMYRSYWVQTGREWRRKGYNRFVSQYAWIQKYFDEGYYEIDRTTR